MSKKSLKRFLPLTAMLAMVLIITGCSSQGTPKLSVTEEATKSEGMSNLPQASYWFPDTLLEWNFEDDKDAKFNLSTVKLQERVAKEDLPNMNGTQDPDTKVIALSIMNSTTSGNVPRGSNTFKANVFSNWQYIDQLVYWGGSSGEGIIVPPSADVIDAAHKNGVPVLGTIFFPQTAHGGKLEWLDTFLTKDADGKFPIVDKMIEVAETYGFEGWFINQETDTKVTSFDDVAQGKVSPENVVEEGLSKKHADLMIELIKQFKADSEDLDIMWYDSMTSDGEMNWQNALTDDNKDYMVDADLEPISDTMFLNFWWNTNRLEGEELLKASNKLAKELGIDPMNLFAGIDVQERGTSTPVRWNLFLDENNKPYTSLGLYVPSWTHSSTDNPETFQERESNFWVNGFGDPRLSVVPEDRTWAGISTFALEQTAVTKLPFKTNYNVGNGYNYFIDGEKVSSLDWNNRSMQDVMPTYRWVMDHEGNNSLDAFIDYSNAYQGGNSLRFFGNMEKDAKSNVKLYATNLEFTKGYTITTTAKADAETSVNLVLGLADGSSVTLEGDKTAGKDWTTISYDVKDLVDKTITSISYELIAKESNNGVAVHLGQLAIQEKASKSKMAQTKVTLEDAVFDEEESNYAGIRLFWDMNEDDTQYYELYRVNQDKSRSFLGATPANTHYINSLERHDDTNKTNIVVVPVDQYGQRGTASSVVTVEWLDNSVPKADLTASKTLIKPGETVTFTNASSSNTDSVKWEFVGGDIETSEENSVDVTFAAAGKYDVKLIATNAKGDAEVTYEELIVVDEGFDGVLQNLTLNATATASSFVNDSEAPEFAINGNLGDKWCAVGEPPHSITIDLGKVDLVSEVYIGHAEAGGENPDMNSKAYKIEVSKDGNEFTQVTRVLGNTLGETVDTFKPTEAQYVRITIDKPTQGSDSAVRIYEIEVRGLEQ